MIYSQRCSNGISKIKANAFWILCWIRKMYYKRHRQKNVLHPCMTKYLQTESFFETSGFKNNSLMDSGDCWYLGFEMTIFKIDW